MYRLDLRKFILLSIILITLTINLVKATPSVYKSVTRRITVLPGDNKISMSDVYVSLTVEGNGTFTILDKIFVNNLTKIKFYNENSTKIIKDGYFVNIEWSDISVSGRKAIGYSTREKAFLDVKVSIEVNGEPVDSIYCNKGYCLIQADAGSYINYLINLSNRFAINGTRIPLTLIVSANIDSKYIELVNCSDHPSFVSELGDFLASTWILNLADFKDFKITFRVKHLNSWNEATIPPIRILIPLDPKASLESIKRIEESISSSISSLEDMEASTANFTLFLRNATVMLQNLSYALQNISAMLELTANQSMEASRKLRKASKKALESSNQLNDMAKMLNRRIEDFEKVEFILKKTVKVLEKIEDYAQFLPEQIRKAIKSSKKDILKISNILSSLRNSGKKLKNASNNLRKLGVALREASESMEELGEMLSRLRTIFNETASSIDGSINEMESNFREIEQFFYAMQQVRERMETELEMIRRERLALEMLCKVYEKEEPRIISGRGRKNGFLVSDNVVVHIARLKLRKRQLPRFSKSLKKEEGKAGNLDYLVISTLLGGVGSLGVAFSLKRRKRVPASIEELKEVKELISRIEKLNT